MRFELLGPARFLNGEQPHALKAPPKCLPLLGYLLIHRKTPISREALAFLLWPDDTETQARANLRRHLHRLLRALPTASENWLLSTATTVQWNEREPYTFDVDEFERKSAEQDTREEAASLYRGEFLEGVYDDCVFADRERLRRIQIENYEQLIRAARRDGAFDRAIAVAKQLLGLDPWREDTVRTLMALRHAQGDRAGALAEYEAFATRLQSEMHAAPMPETLAAYEDIMRNALLRTEDAANEQQEQTEQRSFALPFAGREREIGRLSAAWGRAARGNGSAIFIGGDAGIGKTRLAQEIGAIAHEQGATVLSGSTPFPEAQPYQAIVDILRSALPILTSLPISDLWLSVLALLLPELRVKRPELAAPPPLEPERERPRLFEAVAGALEALANARPLLLIVEDAQWAGSATLDLLETIVERLRERAALVLITYRAEEVSRTDSLRILRRKLEVAHLATHLALGALDLQAVQRITRKLGDFGEDDVAAQLFAQSEGNALFLLQVVRNVLDGRGIDASLDLNAAMSRNLERLSENALGVAQSASVFGRAFDVEMLAQLSACPEAHIVGALDELLDRAVMREASSLYQRDYAFTHSVLQNHVYGMLGEKRRAREHRRAAQVLCDLFTDAPELESQIARHFETAGLAEESAEHYLRAARHSQTLFANVEALQYAQRAAQLSDLPKVRYDAYLICETIRGQLGMRDEQAADLDRIEEIATKHLDGAARLETLRRRAALLHALGQREQEAAAIDSLEVASRGGAASEWAAEITVARASLHMANGNLAQAAAQAEGTLSLTSDTSARIRALCLRADIDAARGRFEEARIFVRDARRAAEAAENSMLLARCLYSGALVAFSQGRFEEARDTARTLLELCERIGDKEGAAQAHARLASCDGRLFEFDSAEHHYAAAGKDYQDMRDPQGQAVVLLNGALLHCGLGAMSEAVDECERSFALFERIGDLRGQSLSMGNMSFALRALGRLEEAVNAGQRALTAALQLGSPAVEAHARGNLGAALRDSGQLDAALEQLALAMKIRKANEASPDLAEDAADLALVLLLLGKKDEALEVASEIDRFSPPASAWYAQDAWWILSRVCRACGLEERADEAAQRARALLEERLAHVGAGTRGSRYARARYNPEILAATASQPAGARTR